MGLLKPLVSKWFEIILLQQLNKVLLEFVVFDDSISFTFKWIYKCWFKIKMLVKQNYNWAS